MTQTYNTYFSDNVSIKQTTPVSQTTHQDRNTYLPDHKSMKTQRTYLPRNRVGIKTQTPVFQTTKNEDTDNTCLAQDYVRRQTRLISESKHKDTCKPLFPRRSSMKTQKTTTNLATNNNYLARRRSMNQTQLTWGLFLNRRSCSHELHVFVSMHKALCIITYICGVMCHTSTLPPVTWYQTLLKRRRRRRRRKIAHQLNRIAGSDQIGTVPQVFCVHTGVRFRYSNSRLLHSSSFFCRALKTKFIRSELKRTKSYGCWERHKSQPQCQMHYHQEAQIATTVSDTLSPRSRNRNRNVRCTSTKNHWNQI